LLGAEWYRPEGVEVLDLFPHTPHVETVTRFVRSSGGVAGHAGGDPRTR
jgi:hypothetical protein